MDSRASSTRLITAASLVVAVSMLFTAPADTRKRGNFEGPVEATVLDVLDGDTFLAEAHVWPGQVIEVNVRVRGIDAPEMKSRCEAEHIAALKARKALIELIGERVRISNIGSAKYYGRRGDARWGIRRRTDARQGAGQSLWRRSPCRLVRLSPAHRSRQWKRPFPFRETAFRVSVRGAAVSRDRWGHRPHVMRSTKGLPLVQAIR
jgi:micrococcal nuclease